MAVEEIFSNADASAWPSHNATAVASAAYSLSYNSMKPILMSISRFCSKFMTKLFIHHHTREIEALSKFPAQYRTPPRSTMPMPARRTGSIGNPSYLFLFDLLELQLFVFCGCAAPFMNACMRLNWMMRRPSLRIQEQQLSTIACTLSRANLLPCY